MATPKSRSASTTFFAITLFIAAALVAGYWIAFYGPGWVRASEAKEYLTFQYACTLPDAMMSLLFVMGGVMLLEGRPRAVIPIYLGAGAMAFLALLDFSFNIVFGTYSTLAGAVSVEILINIACLAYSVVATLFCLRWSERPKPAPSLAEME